MNVMAKLLVAASLTMFGSTAAAQWITTEFTAVHLDDSETARETVNTDFSELSDNGRWSGNDFVYDAWNVTISEASSEMLTRIFEGASYDAKRLAEAGARAPNVSELLFPTNGSRSIPVYWEMFKGLSGLASWSCIDRRISMNNSSISIARLTDRWMTEDQYIVDATSATLMHEVVHSIQAAADNRWDCVSRSSGSGTASSSWIGEATASGFANYLLSKRNPDALKSYEWARLARQYSKALYDVDEKYTSQSFFVYLLEATEAGGRSDLSLAVDILNQFTRQAAETRNGTLALLASIVEDHASTESHKRPFALILAEFLTEYASYSERFDIEEALWISRGFSNCINFSMTPGSVDTIEFPILANSGRCIRVDWNGFVQPVGLQFFLEGSGIEYGSLHMGQASYNLNGRRGHCYEVTSRIDNRLASYTDRKCILRRGVQLMDGQGRSYTLAGWTSDINLIGSGHSYYILANASEDITASTKLDVTVTVGTNLVRDRGAEALPARMRVDLPIQDGLTRMDSRVHAIAAGPGRVMFDGRSIFGDGIDVGFLEGAPGAGEIDGGGAIVRAGDYMIMLVKDKQGVPDAAMIVRDPQTSGGRSITTLGTQGLGDIPSCGYAVPATIDFLTTSDDLLRFKVSGDLFDLSPATMMAAGQNGMCNALRAAHVEYKSIEVSLPFPELYDGNIEITRAYPPMQDIYDELEFRSGPSFGGIDTSRSLVLGDGVVGDENTIDPDDIGTSTVGGDSSAVQCTCHCPNIVSPTTGACFNQCEPVFQMCPDPNSTDALNADASRYSGILEEQGLADTIRDMLLSDFSAMSGETRSQIIREALWN